MANLVDSLVEEITSRMRPIIAEAVQTVLIGGSADTQKSEPARRGRAASAHRTPDRRRPGGSGSYVVGETRGRLPGWLAGSTGATSSKDLAKRWAKGTVLTKGQELPPDATSAGPTLAESSSTPELNAAERATPQPKAKVKTAKARRTGSARKLAK